MNARARMLSALIGLALVLGLVGAPRAQGLPTARPEQVGLSAERLDRIAQMVRADVEKGRLPGAVVLVARKGRVAYFEAWGFRDKTAGAPLTRDAIFRIYSMTKPITSVAVMMLVEEGKLQLTDPVSKHLPQLARREVGIERVPAEREMTIQDLLRHTSGLTYGVFGKSAVKDLYTKSGTDATDHTNAELIDKLARLPLHYQPGTTWEYSRSTDVLGRVVEVVSGRTLAEFFAERIFRPLKMTDSGFWVPGDRHARLAQPLANDPDTGRPVKLYDVTVSPRYEAGGQGLVATASDYLRFCQMLLGGGQLEGVRLLGKKTVEAMTSDQLGEIKFRPGQGFGFGFAVRKEPGLAGTLGSAGEYYWAGLGGTSFWVDPREQLIGIWMAQGPGQREHYRGVFKNLVLQSLVE